MVITTTSPLDISLDVDALRRVAVRAAEASNDAVIRRQLQALRPSEDLIDLAGLTFAADHAGDTPIPLDAVAREAVREVLERELPRIVGDRRHHEAGEEAGGGTAVVRRGDFIHRTDDLDGSTNADCLLNNYSAVVGIDIVREAVGPDRRARHLVGAIALSTGITVSWINDSQWVPQLRQHRSHRGRVYFSSGTRGIPEFEIGDARWDRRARTYAGVASKRARLDALLVAIGGADPSDVIYNVAGTPVVAALIAGALGENIEVEKVALHDSMHLIPHQLLGGEILHGTTREPLDYLALYERETVNLDPRSKPVPPYIAIGGIAASRR